MRSIVVPYKNPDLDGVACAIAVEVWSSREYQARIIGNVDEETCEVLGSLDLAVPDAITDWAAVERIWLVDTHHPAQLPIDLPANRVVQITDHHPAGSPATYPNATVQNEPVGAAATLIAERFLEADLAVPPRLAVLLQAAIVSNTLDFRAPATSSRDSQAYSRLRTIESISNELKARMSSARRTVLKLDTKTLLSRDIKSFGAPPNSVVVAQVEAPGAIELLGREGLHQELRDLAARSEASAAIAVFVDLEAGESAVVTSAPGLGQRLSQSLGVRPLNGIMRVGRILQRKTDIVPTLVG